MKKKLLLGLSFVGVAAAAASLATTLAAFNSSDSEVNVMTAGNVQIKLVEQQREGGELVPFKQGKAITPLVGSAQGEKDKFGMPVAANYQDKIISVENTGANEAYVRVLMAVPAVLDDADASKSPLHVNYGNRVDFTGTGAYNTGEGWKTTWRWDSSSVDTAAIQINGETYNVYCYTYKDALATGAQTSAAIAGVYLDSSVNYENGEYVMGKRTLTGFNGVVTLPVIAQAVQTDGFKDSLTAFAEAFPYGEDNKNLTAWFNNTGLVNATATENGVAGYDPVEKGTNIVDGLTVIDNSAETANLRALYTKAGTVKGDFTVANSYLDGTYAMNVIGDDTGVLTVSNTALRGWVSYDGFKSATFTNVTFGANTNPEIYNTIRPYSEVKFEKCAFDGTDFWLDKLPEGAQVTFVNSTMNGELIDSVEDITIVYGDKNSVVIANS